MKRLSLAALLALTAACAHQNPMQPDDAPHLALTRFVAYGDSITEGVLFSDCRNFSLLSFRESLRFYPKAANATWSYPAVLQTLLNARYTSAPPVVLNRGLGGERTDDAPARFAQVLASDHPQVVLLQDGQNDVVQHRTAAEIAASLRGLIHQARASGALVLLGTVLPQKTSPCRDYLAPADVPPANDAIRQMAAAEQVPLIDTYSAFGASPGDLISVDGLHPSASGYERFAETYFSAIRQLLER
jgi:lysophospholipase L1-like esterase